MRREPGRVMALDLGGQRIGVALSDALRVLASPLTTVRAQPRAAAIAQISALIASNEVAELVIGLPLTLSGEVGPQAKLVQEYVEELRRHISIPIHMVDERLTSVEAERMMTEMGIKREQRRARIDEVAASIILRDFLEANRPPRRDDEWDL
ncbi:MAG: Holliday junction resolvase RuvX [Roseiflexaceae bacterium]